MLACEFYHAISIDINMGIDTEADTDMDRDELNEHNAKN
jgi:hypothetical protein